MVGGLNISTVDKVKIPKNASQRKRGPQERRCLAQETRFRSLDAREAGNATFFEVPLQVRSRSQEQGSAPNAERPHRLGDAARCYLRAANGGEGKDV